MAPVIPAVAAHVVGVPARVVAVRARLRLLPAVVARLWWLVAVEVFVAANVARLTAGGPAPAAAPGPSRGTARRARPAAARRPPSLGRL